jgi:hypothetical protein
MAIYKHVSSKEIIRKVFRDLKPATGNWLHDSIEWIGEALEHIGASAQLCTKHAVIPIANHKGALPGDLYYINQVAINTCVSASVDTQIDTVIKKIDTLNSNILDYSKDLANATVTGAELNDYRVASTNQLRDLNVNLEMLTSMYFSGGECLQPLQYGASTFHRGSHCDQCVNEITTYKETYVINCGSIQTSFETGYVCISYMAFPTDEECYPMVPDDISFREAMFWYIYKKLLLQGEQLRNNRIQYEYADAAWQKYCTQARNAANYPDIDRYESFMDQWVRLKPNLNRHFTFFESLNDREMLQSENF